MGTNRISSTIISWYLSICGYGLEHPLFIQWGWLAQGHAFGLLRWRPGFDSREDVLAVSVPMYEPVCGSLGTGWEFYHLGPHWLVLNPQPTNQPLFISVFHSKDIQGDHLGMYLKHTARISIDRQWNFIHCSNTQGGSFYQWQKKDSIFWKVVLQNLIKVAPRFANWRG